MSGRYDWVGMMPDGDAWTVELDWADDVDSALAYEAAGFQVTVVDPHGPGGGWLVVRFRGPREKIATLLADYHDDPAMAEALS